MRRITLIDGGSGCGKTTFAQALAADCRAHGRPTQLVSLDDMYPGWYGLAAASHMVVTDVLDRNFYRRWDWEHDVPADRVEVDPSLDLIVEGCGAITPASAARATHRIWLEMPARLRRRRALSRADGAGYRPWWDTWAAQEREHWRADTPWLLADRIVRPG